jgi:hypothetical protein
MDSKPLRQEDYQALAEENRQLREKLEKLTPKKKKDPSPLWKRIKGWPFWTGTLGLLFFLCVIFAIVAAGIDERKKEEDESGAAPKCFYVGKPHSQYRPWDPWRIWEIKRGKSGKTYWYRVEDLDKRFKTSAEAHQFLDDNGAKDCGDSP